ncbi:hypothetical protein, partial [Niastella populi]|uniref:hypothetical protein n=1 Tax=Niastella populi TaxID=550983 RepID=UPI001A99B0C6
NVLVFIILNFIVALIQIPLVMFLLWMNNKPWFTSAIIKDGSLFFFTCSLCVTSFFNSLKKEKHKSWILCSLAIGGAACFLSVVCFTWGTIATLTKGSFEYQGKFTAVQIFCLISSFVYAFYIEYFSGGFKEKLMLK